MSTSTELMVCAVLGFVIVAAMLIGCAGKQDDE